VFVDNKPPFRRKEVHMNELNKAMRIPGWQHGGRYKKIKTINEVLTSISFERFILIALMIGG
jgi:hypothetical protein